ncbi:hypothetical protein [Luteolibacter soli]|uniref:HEAT repeat domain-containing protein n=1 Tax=Luteolibacter soli TaxID=3135280 RepID=A0ABU9APF2_9BACT
MKATLLIIVLVAITTGWWQGQELSRLKQREAELRAVSGKTGAAVENGATKSSQREARPVLDGAGFVALIAKSLKEGVPLTEKERMLLRDQIAAASGHELKQWALMLRDSELPEEVKKDILVSIGPRVAESDPKLAAELVVDGNDGSPFRTVMRTWLSADAAAAAAWLEGISPPKFKNRGELDFPALLLAAKVAADPAGIDELLGADAKLCLSALWEFAATQTPGDLSNVLHRVSLDSKLPEGNRVHIIGGTLARHRDPAVARQILLDAGLPEEQFVKVAAEVIQSLDPAGKAAGIEWAEGLPDSSRRTGLLASLREGERH